MTRERKTGDVVCALIRQAIDDARYHSGAARTMAEMGSTEAAIQRGERALGAYREAEAEFVIQYDAINAKRRNNIDSELDEVHRKLWIMTAIISGVVKNNAVLYNQLRSLRRSFLIPGGVVSNGTRAAGGGR